MKKSIAILLIAAQLAMLAACGGDTPSAVTDTKTAETTAAETGSARANTPDTVPADLNFGGKTVTLLSRQDVELFKWEFYAEEQTGDILNDAIYARNRAVEERLNVNIEIMFGEGTWGKWTTFYGLIQGAALAGDGSIDIVPFYAYEQAGLAAQGLYVNLLDDSVKYLDLSQPWWNQSLVESATINDCLYYATGEIAISSIAMMAAIAFNQRLAEVYLPEANFYQDVRDGVWTFDKMFGYSRNLYDDVNGNAVRDEADIYGFDGGRGDQFIHSAKVEISKNGADGIPVLALSNERMVKLVDTVQAFYSQPGYAPSTLEYEGKTSVVFPYGHCLFSNRYVRDIASLRDMEDDYGVLPMPKLDETQDGYYTTLGDSYSQVAIVVGTDVLDAASATMELLAAESYRSVTEVYFENVLKVKHARDEDTAEMLDILLAGIDVDFTEVFGKLIGAPVGKMRNCLQEKCESFASKYASIEESVNTQIKALFDDFNK